MKRKKQFKLNKCCNKVLSAKGQRFWNWLYCHSKGTLIQPLTGEEHQSLMFQITAKFEAIFNEKEYQCQKCDGLITDPWHYH